MRYPVAVGKQSYGDDGDEPVCTTWFGMNQPRPKLPYYFPTERRLKSLDEFEEPYWKGRVRFGADDDEVTVKGVARETVQWLLIFAITAIVVGSFWLWFGSPTCAELFGGFKIGWC